MSYEIVYAKQFIKTKNYIIPVVLMGSNNCTMYYGGREIRDRNWTPLSNNLVGLTAEELKRTIFEKWTNNGTSTAEFFKQNGKWAYAKELLNFINTGIKKALTIDAIKESTGYSTDCYLSIWDNHEHHTELNEYISNNEDFEQWLTKAQERIKNKKESECIYYYIGWSTIKPLKAYNTQIEGKVLVKYKNNYLISKDSFTFSKDKSQAIIFDNIEQAKEHCKGWDFKFVKYNPKTRPPKEKNFVIKYSGTYCNCYMAKHTRSRIFGTMSLSSVKQKFETREKAQNFIDTILKYFDVRNCEVVDIRELATSQNS